MVVLDFEQEDVKFQRRETELARHENVAATYLESLAGRNVAAVKVLQLVPAPVNQKPQMWLPIPNSVDLQVVEKSFANEVQNVPAQEAKLAIAGVQR